jgi:hypothetical protein
LRLLRFYCFGGKTTMSQFDPEIVKIMRAALAEVCSHIPEQSPDARAFVASKILESANRGEETYEGLLQVGRRAVIERFGTVNVLRARPDDDNQGAQGNPKPRKRMAV